MNKHELFMLEALKEAEIAYSLDEVPVGVVIVKDEQIIARGHNTRENDISIVGHAEINAINEASRKLGTYRLDDCDIYVTMEPCIMCAGALLQSHIKTIYFGASDLKGGAFISSIDVRESKNINYKPRVVSSILEEECSNLIKKYFENKR